MKIIFLNEWDQREENYGLVMGTHRFKNDMYP